jgi:hypothetical protein
LFGIEDVWFDRRRIGKFGGSVNNSSYEAVESFDLSSERAVPARSSDLVPLLSAAVA